MSSYALLDDVKEYLGIQNNNNDDMIDNILLEVTALLDGYAGRSFFYNTYTNDFFIYNVNSPILFLKNTPIENIIDIKVDDVSIFGNIEYVINNDTGELTFLNPVPYTKTPYKISVEYTGGYVNIPYDIKLACKTQTSFFYQRRNSIGAQSVASGEVGGRLVLEDSFSMLPLVKNILDKYRIRNV